MLLTSSALDLERKTEVNTKMKKGKCRKLFMMIFWKNLVLHHFCSEKEKKNNFMRVKTSMMLSPFKHVLLFWTINFQICECLGLFCYLNYFSLTVISKTKVVGNYLKKYFMLWNFVLGELCSLQSKTKTLYANTN